VKLSHLTDPEEDSVRIYRLCETCRARVEIQGRGERSEDPEVYVL
jgi:CRISPR/Cas system-associated endoribonuclease Cas2